MNAVPALNPDADYRDALDLFRRAGWTYCGAGDWACALRSPNGAFALRISPFDPTGTYTAALYRDAAHTGLVPRLFEHRRLEGGGDLQVMEWLHAVDTTESAAFHHSLAAREPALTDLADIVQRIHSQAKRELPWLGPLDENPSNVMRTTDGHLVITDPFYADGPSLFDTAAGDPDTFVSRIPESQRRFMTKIPLAFSGPWPPASREAMRLELAAADARATAE